MSACCCSSPVCRIHGCQGHRGYSWSGSRPTAPLPPQYHPNQTHPLIPLTEADVRRIIREELAGAKGE